MPVLLFPGLEVKYRPDQPRIPRGMPGAGRWVRIGGPRLSLPQTRALRSLASGGSGGRPATIRALSRRGLIRQRPDGGWELTDAGREALGTTGPSSALEQVRTDTAREVVGLASQVEEDIAKGASDRAVLHRVRSHMRRLRLEPTGTGSAVSYTWRQPDQDLPITPTVGRVHDVNTRTEIEQVAAGTLAAIATQVEAMVSAGEPRDSIVAEVRRLMSQAGFEPIAQPGERVMFDPSEHTPIGSIARGRTAQVIRPGYRWQLPDGTVVVLEKPTVLA